MSEYDREAPTMSRPWLTGGCRATGVGGRGRGELNELAV